MRKNKLLSIVKHYGILHQIKYLYTEIFELTEAVISGDINHITEEYADCMVLLAQVCEYFKLDHISIDVIMNNKIDRQLKRIENEYWLGTLDRISINNSEVNNDD